MTAVDFVRHNMFGFASIEALVLGLVLGLTTVSTAAVVEPTAAEPGASNPAAATPALPDWGNCSITYGTNACGGGGGGGSQLNVGGDYCCYPLDKLHPKNIQLAALPNFLTNVGGWYGPEPPPGLSFADDGTVVYTNPIDPKQDSTRNNAVVDPASGSLRFRIPLPHRYAGRTSPVELDLTFNSARNRPGGPLGNYWGGSWERLLVLDFTDDLGANCDAKVISYQDFLNATSQIVEHTGSSSIVWAGEDAIEKQYSFDPTVAPAIAGKIPDVAYKVEGIPAGALQGQAFFQPPNGSTRNQWTVLFQGVFTGGPGDEQNPPPPTEQGPMGKGALLSGMRVSATALPPEMEEERAQERGGDTQEFLPPLGDARKMKPSCERTFIRHPDGRLDVFTPFFSVGEHPIQTNEAMTSPARIQMQAKLIETFWPNGDRIGYLYDDRARLKTIVDNHGREVVEFFYVADTNRLSHITDIDLHTTTFEYANDVLTAIDLPRTNQRWEFTYQIRTVLPDPSTAGAKDHWHTEILKQGYSILESFDAKAPRDQPTEPSLQATFENQAPVGRFWKEYPCITDLTLGGNFPMDVDIDGDGTVDHTFQTNQTIQYQYNPATELLGNSTTTITDSEGHVTTHTFDWQSRELSRTEHVTTGSSTVDETTTFDYWLHWPSVIRTTFPRGNALEEDHQFQLDESPTMKSYYSRTALARDRFAGNNVLANRAESGSQERANPRSKALRL